MIQKLTTAMFMLGMSSAATADVNLIGPDVVEFEQYVVSASETGSDIIVTFEGGSSSGCYRSAELEINPIKSNLYFVQVQHLAIPRRVCMPEEVRTFELKRSIVLPKAEYGVYATFLVKASDGLQANAEIFEASNVQETRVLSAKITPINAGINPYMRAVKISLTVSLGSNSCFARDKEAKLEVEKIDGEYHVIARIIDNSSGNLVACPMHYMPVMKQLETTIRYLNNDFFKGIFIDNYGVMGTDINVEQLSQLR